MFSQMLVFLAAERQRQCRAPLAMRLEGQKVVLRPHDVADWREWTQLRHISEAFLQPWEPEWPAQSTSMRFYMQHWRRLARRWAQDREYSFAITARDGGALLGGVTLTDIQRGARECATLGYWVGLPHVGRGYGSEAAKLAVDFGFSQLGLKRIEASCMPDNAASLRVLKALGMREIGLSCNYMQIGKKWRDHLLFEVTAPDLETGTVDRRV